MKKIYAIPFLLFCINLYAYEYSWRFAEDTSQGYYLNADLVVSEVKNHFISGNDFYYSSDNSQRQLRIELDYSVPNGLPTVTEDFSSNTAYSSVYYLYPGPGGYFLLDEEIYQKIILDNSGPSINYTFNENLFLDATIQVTPDDPGAGISSGTVEYRIGAAGDFIHGDIVSVGWGVDKVFFRAVDSLGNETVEGYVIPWSIKSSDEYIFTEDVEIQQVLKVDEVAANNIVSPVSAFPDYVFSDNYKLDSISNLETYINNNGHLPGVPACQEITSGGIDLQEVIQLQVEKIEELILYTIRLKQWNERLKSELALIEESLNVSNQNYDMGE